MNEVPEPCKHGVMPELRVAVVNGAVHMCFNGDPEHMAVIAKGLPTALEAALGKASEWNSTTGKAKCDLVRDIEELWHKWRAEGITVAEAIAFMVGGLASLALSAGLRRKELTALVRDACIAIGQ